MRGRHKRSKSEVIVCAKTSPLVRSFWAQFGLQFGLPHHADLDQVHLVYCAVTYDAAGGGFRASHVLGSMQGLLPLLIRQRAAVVRVDGNARQVSERPVVQCPTDGEPKARASVTDHLVDIRYVCAACGMETHRIRLPQSSASHVLGSTQGSLPLLIRQRAAVKEEA